MSFPFEPARPVSSCSLVHWQPELHDQYCPRSARWRRAVAMPRVKSAISSFVRSHHCRTLNVERVFAAACCANATAIGTKKGPEHGSGPSKLRSQEERREAGPAERKPAPPNSSVVVGPFAVLADVEHFAFHIRADGQDVQ